MKRSICLCKSLNTDSKYERSRHLRAKGMWYVCDSTAIEVFTRVYRVLTSKIGYRRHAISGGEATAILLYVGLRFLFSFQSVRVNEMARSWLRARERIVASFAEDEKIVDNDINGCDKIYIRRLTSGARVLSSIRFFFSSSSLFLLCVIS